MCLLVLTFYLIIGKKYFEVFAIFNIHVIHFTGNRIHIIIGAACHYKIIFVNLFFFMCSTMIQFSNTAKNFEAKRRHKIIQYKFKVTVEFYLVGLNSYLSLSLPCKNQNLSIISFEQPVKFLKKFTHHNAPLGMFFRNVRKAFVFQPPIPQLFI